MNNNSFSFGKIKSGYEKLYPIFSFKNYRETKYFKQNDVLNKKEFYNFFNHISSFSTLTWGDIKSSGDYHFHEIDDDKNINQKLKISEAISLIQFKLVGDKESRFIGYFDNSNIFNIIAYDYNHEVYPRK